MERPTRHVRNILCRESINEQFSPPTGAIGSRSGLPLLVRINKKVSGQETREKDEHK